MNVKQIKGMRRKFSYMAIPALFLALALAGCQQESIPATGDVIRFSVNSVEIAPAPTKADDLPTVTAPTTELTASGSKVKVWASLNTENPENWKYVFAPEPSIVIENNGTAWIYSGDKYWNRDAEYRFKAVYPFDANIQSSSDVDLVTVNYAGTAQDLMVASSQLSNTYVKTAKTVDLAFSHTCSAIRIYLVDPDRGTNPVRFTITALRLQNLFMAGSLAYDWLKFVWSPSGDRTTGYTWAKTTEDSDKVPATYTAFTPWLFFIPQTPDQASIYLSYTTGSQTLEATLAIDKDSNNDPIKWEPGKMYTYFIKIRPKGIEMKVEWTDWGTAEHEYTTG